MRPGLPQPRYARRQPDAGISALLGTNTGAAAAEKEASSDAGSRGESKKPLALPPIPTASADAGSSVAAVVAVPKPPALRDGIRQPDGTLVPAMDSVVAKSPRPGHHTVTKALTARKPTDSDAGRLAAKLMAMERTRSANAGPVSQFPVHGGATTVRSAAASCARPPLAIELESFVKRELNMLVRQIPTADALAKVSIGKEAFGCFITHFPEYSGPLELIKTLYDDAVAAAFSLRQQRHALETENIGFRDYHTTVLEKEKAEAKQAATNAQSTMNELRRLLDRQQARQQELELELHRMTNTLSERNQQLDEAESRATLFEKSVIELTDKGVAVQQRLSAVRRENERLHHNVAMLEQQVREAEAGVSEAMGASMSRRRKSQFAGPTSTVAGSMPPRVKSGQTLTSTVGGATAMRNVVREAVLSDQGERSPTTTARKTTSFAEDTAGGPFGGDGGGSGDDELDMPLPGEDTREAVLELEARLKRVTRQNYLLTSEREALMQRLESLQANLEREKNDMTPRPPWQTAQEILPGFSVNSLATSEETLADLIQFFKDELTEEKREAERKALSKTVRDWLGQEDLCEGDLVGKHRYFVCRGTGGHVPVYLRARGVVRNRKIRKGDVEKLLAKLWSDRRISLRVETNLNATPIGDFFHEWLIGVTGNSTAAVELAYNILAVCEQYQQDPDCGMFIRIMRGELCEHAMYEQHDLLENLLEMMRVNDPHKKKVLSRFTLHRILNKFFPTKSRQDMLRLRFSLMLSCKGQTLVDYDGLFAEDEEGNQSRFVETIRRQHVEEATSFTVAVEEALREAIRDDGKLDLNNARMSLKHLDPAMPNTRIEEVMAFGCGLTLHEMERYGQFFAVEAEPFLERVRRGVLLHRYSRATNDESDGGSDDDGGLYNDDRAERERAREEGIDDEERDIIVPESRFRNSSVFGSSVTHSSGGQASDPKPKESAAKPNGKPNASPPKEPLSPAGASKVDSAPLSPSGTKKLMTAAEKKEDFAFLQAFTKPSATERARRASVRRASVLAALEEETKPRPRRKSLAEALVDGQPVTASVAFDAITVAMDEAQ